MPENVRPATAQDAPALAELYRLVWAEEAAVLGDRLVAERSADPEEIRRWIENDTYYVLEADGGIVAVLGCEECHGTLHLVHLVTHPDHRRRGYAAALIKQAEELALQTGAVKIWFDTAAGLEASNLLYGKLGYDKCGMLRKHYWGTDVVFYEKVL